MRITDFLWNLALAMPVFLGGTANKYLKTKQLYYDNEMFPYYDFELPGDKDCNDIPNKRKWLHKYRKWNKTPYKTIEFRKRPD